MWDGRQISCNMSLMKQLICAHLRTRNLSRSWCEPEADNIRKQSQGSTINSSTLPYKRYGSNITTPPDDESEDLNLITGIATRTRATIFAAFNSTMPASNETQVPNDVTGSDQCATLQAAQPVSSQVNDDEGGVNGDNHLLPQTLDANEFENVANHNDSDFNTKILHGILCHIKKWQSSSCQFHHRKTQ